MNYIKRLEKENSDLKKALVDVGSAVHGFKAELDAPKFNGVESDGGRKDWMSTQDIRDRLDRILQG
jgi:hypothetical protein